jgi:putative inorganic carbon (hco3(-)) transporter
MKQNELTYQKQNVLSVKARDRQFIAYKKTLIVVFILLSIGVTAGLLAAVKPAYAVSIPVVLGGIIIALTCLLHAEIGLYIIMFYSFFISYLNRLLLNDTLSIGIYSDLLILITMLGFIARKSDLKSSINTFVKTPVVPVFLLFYLYTIIEVFNPAGFSIQGAIPAFRKVMATISLLFIAFNVLNTYEAVKRFTTVLLIFGGIVALYACIQEWHGFFDFEMNWLRADERRFRMTFVNGGARRFSTFPDSPSLSVVMTVCCVFFLGTATGLRKKKQRWLFFTVAVFCLLALTYSLTRTANVMLVGGIGFFILITLNRKISRIIAGIGIAIFLFIMFAPVYSNNQINQFRQTFKGGTKDPSYMVREMNRKAIRPYMYRHPFGGGLNTTGEEAYIYHPGHPLAGFPPDGGFMKKALELGWVGFALALFLYFTILKTGIRGYFAAKRREYKIMIAAATAAMFSQYVGEIAQVALGQITDIVIYYPFIAMILNLQNMKPSVNPSYEQ